MAKRQSGIVDVTINGSSTEFEWSNTGPAQSWISPEGWAEVIHLKITLTKEIAGAIGFAWLMGREQGDMLARHQIGTMLRTIIEAADPTE